MRENFAIAIILLVACAVNAWSQVPEVLYLKFNEGSGTTTADSSLLGLPGFSPVLNSGGNNVWNNSSPILGPSCAKSSPFSSYWKFNSNPHLTGDWTIEFWYYMDSAVINSIQLPFVDDSLNGFRFRTALGPSGDIYLDANDLGLETSFGTFVINAAVSAGLWQHLALVCDKAEGTITPFLNGVRQPSALVAGTTDIMGNDPTKFGTSVWPGSLDEIRFWDHARTQTEIVADMSSELSATSNDLIVSAITSPVYVPRSYVFPNATEVVTCEVENAGTNVIAAGASLSLSFQVNGSALQTETLTLATSLAPGDRLTYGFSATADLTGLGPQTVKVTVNWAGDSRPTNNSRERTIGNSKGTLVNEFPWFDDFEDTPKDQFEITLNWFQEPELVASLDIDWVAQKYTGVGVPNPPGRYAAGGVAVIAGEVINSSVRTPTMDFRGLAHPRMRFWAKNDVQGSVFGIPGLFSIDVIEYPSGLVTPNYFGPIGDLGPNWVELQIDLSPFAGKIVDLRLKMENSSTTIGGTAIYMDDVLIYDHQIGQGQAPQLGLAEFEINDSQNIGMNAASYGEAGPYFQSAVPGESLAFIFRGLPAQPILLAYGPLNPVAATFPGLGQLDIGGPLEPLSGIPTFIQVLFDGSLAGGLNGLFVTGPVGEMVFTTPMPYLPPGVLTTFQAVLRDPTTGLLVISNAVQLEVN